MAALKSLSFMAVPKAVSDPVQVRRAKLVARLEEQKCFLIDPNVIRAVQRIVKENGRNASSLGSSEFRTWCPIDADL
jgi:hypothetical protein